MAELPSVGALHADGSTWAGLDQRIDLIRHGGLPSTLSTVASGYNRSVKPDVLFPGGRQLYLQIGLHTQVPPRFSIARSSKVPGLQESAALDLNRKEQTRPRQEGSRH